MNSGRKSSLRGYRFSKDPLGTGGRALAVPIGSLALLAIAALFPATAAAAPCDSMARLALPNTVITSADAIAAGSFTPLGRQPPPAQLLQNFKNLPAFCRVAAIIKPSRDSDIKIEVWMPQASGWNGKFLAVGNGGWAGTINYRGLAESLRLGYATASTDTGHTGDGGDASFAFNHSEKLIDLGYRSIHVMTLAAKEVIAAFYGSRPRLSYWNGCSTGGKQGLTEAQRFPDDYNGIVEGDPAAFWTHLMFGVMWPSMVLKDTANSISSTKLKLLHKAVMDACDKLDGVQDGIIENPDACHFDPKVLECKGSDTSACLTATQVEAVRKLCDGPKNPRTGQTIFPGFEPGSELSWHGPPPISIPVTFFKFVLFKNPEWQWQTLNFDRDVELADHAAGSILNAVDPNLEPFRAHNGKLLMYHGWNDTIIAPGESVDYFNRVLENMGGAPKTNDFVRLFMIPGMGHCRGGPGPDTFDKVEVLEKWVEQGIAPDRIIASHRSEGVVDLTRPLCPYPKVAHWKASGSTTDPANFACVNPKEQGIE